MSDGKEQDMSSRQPRLAPPDTAALTPEQQAVHDAIAAGPRGTVRGPALMWLLSPDLAAAAQKLGEHLRWGTVFDLRLSELAILTTARHYRSDYMWFNHVPVALKAGLTQAVIDALRDRTPPPFAADDEAAVHAFCSEALTATRVSDAALEGIVSRFGPRGAVELCAIMGHYHHGALVLATAGLPRADGAPDELGP